jgi:hypothetical protein
MLTLKQIAQNIKKIDDIDADELSSEIICAFEDYVYKGESEIIVTDNQAYANHTDAPIIRFEIIKNNDGTISVTDAWIA